MAPPRGIVLDMSNEGAHCPCPTTVALGGRFRPRARGPSPRARAQGAQARGPSPCRCDALSVCALRMSARTTHALIMHIPFAQRWGGEARLGPSSAASEPHNLHWRRGFSPGAARRSAPGCSSSSVPDRKVPGQTIPGPWEGKPSCMGDPVSIALLQALLYGDPVRPPFPAGGDSQSRPGGREQADPVPSGGALIPNPDLTLGSSATKTRHLWVKGP